MKNKGLKVLISFLFIAMISCMSVFAQDVVTEDKALKTLNGNSKQATITVEMSVNGMTISENGEVYFPLMEKAKFTVFTELESEFLSERIKHLGSKKVLVVFELAEIKPKKYKCASVSGLETVEEYQIRIEKEANEAAGLGFILNSEVTAQKEANKAAGKGEITDYQVEMECKNNESLYGYITNYEADIQRKANKAAGKGEITDYQVDNEININKTKGYGAITNYQVSAQRKANKASRLGNITDEEKKTQIAANKAAGKGSYTDYELLMRTVFDGKSYELKDQYCYALGKYFDLLTSDLQAEDKANGVEPYLMLRDNLLNGYSGFSKYTDSENYERWVKILIDLEKYCSEYGIYDVELGNLEKKDNSTYTSSLKKVQSYRYEKTAAIIYEGFKKARKNKRNLNAIDTKNVCYNSLSYSEMSSPKGEMKGVYFTIDKTTSEVKKAYEDDKNYTVIVSLVDNDGKEFLRSQAKLSDGVITFSNVPSEVMKMIDNGSLRLNVVSMKLSYTGGTCNINRKSFLVDTKEKDLKTKAFDNAIFEVMKKKYLTENFANIYGKGYKILKTEITQGLFEAVMGYNPSPKKGYNLPVYNISSLNACNFCNKLSLMTGREPVYTFSFLYETYTILPQELENCVDSNVCVKEINKKANGYRLPTSYEWDFAARANKNYKYSGSDDWTEVGWFDDITNPGVKPVGTKKPNDFGIYDMSGNVFEMMDPNRCDIIVRGGSVDYLGLTDLNYGKELYLSATLGDYVGFRIVAPLN